jgi:hypothetical protein
MCPPGWKRNKKDVYAAISTRDTNFDGFKSNVKFVLRKNNSASPNLCLCPAIH